MSIPQLQAFSSLVLRHGLWRFCLFFVVGLLILFLGPAPVGADQCAVVERRIGEEVLELVAEGDLVAELCEPCGETEPSWLTVRRVELVDWELDGGRDQLVVIEINDRGVDLAYTYLRVGEKSWHNLAGMAGCEATDVSPEIELVAERPDPQKEEPAAWALTLDITTVPYDGLRFERDWIAAEAITLRGDLDPSANVIQGFPAGTRVRMLEVVSKVSPGRVEVVFERRPFHRGEILYLLHALGEETYRAWYYGKIHEEEVDGIDLFDRLSDTPGCPGPFLGCWGVADQKPVEEIWARVVTESGVEGWVRNPTTWFDGVYSIPREHWPER